MTWGFYVLTMAVPEVRSLRILVDSYALVHYLSPTVMTLHKRFLVTALVRRVPWKQLHSICAVTIHALHTC